MRWHREVISKRGCEPRFLDECKELVDGSPFALRCNIRLVKFKTRHSVGYYLKVHSAKVEAFTRWHCTSLDYQVGVIGFQRIETDKNFYARRGWED